MRQVDNVAFLSNSADRAVYKILVESGSDARPFTIACVRTPPGQGSPDGLHSHDVDQVFYILEGQLRVEIDGTELEAGPGTTVVFPAGALHRNWNAGSAGALHLSIMH